jgi:hypothetical protein
MKKTQAFHPRVTSVTMFTVAVFLISSMSLREYAHFIDHFLHFSGRPGTFTSELDHEARFHCVTEAEPAFEPPILSQQLVAILQLPQENVPSSRPRLLPETRAPPTFS